MSGRVAAFYASGVPARDVAVCLSVLCVLVPKPLHADAGELPGEPPGRIGELAVGPETGLVIPLSNNRLCPADAECIADVGWAVNVGFSYRWRNGLGLGFGYEFWLLTANGVYEVTVPQSFMGVLQYSFLPARRTHPLVRVRGGLLLLGPSFRVAALGGTAEIGAGAEVELTADTVFSFLVTGNVLRTASFVTPADDVLRAASGAIDAMLVLRIGFNFLL